MRYLILGALLLAGAAAAALPAGDPVGRVSPRERAQQGERARDAGATASSGRAEGGTPSVPGQPSAGSAGAAPSVAGRPSAAGGPDLPYYPYNGKFIFARVYYEVDARGLSSWGWGPIGASSGPPWSHDYPIAEQNFTQILRELTLARAFTESGNVLALDDPRLAYFPIAYMSEPGYWNPSQREAEALRNYLLKGGFIIFDDFGGQNDTRQMPHLIQQMSRVLPELTFLPLDADDAVFDSFFRVDPATINIAYMGRRPEWWGLFVDDDKSKRMLAIAGNYGDLGEFWEYSGTGQFPVDLTNEAYKVGINYIIYAMTR